MFSLDRMSRRRVLLSTAGAAALGPLVRSLWGSEMVTAQPSGPATVSATSAQTMQGFGVAGAWWPNDLVWFAPSVQEMVADMLFGPDGIALSAYRYNIGGGGVGVTNPVRAPDTFLVSPGEYDWDKDPGGRLFLRLAAERDVPILVGFVNSAPATFTTNGMSRGGYLQPGMEAAYARYLVDVVAHFRDVEGITLSYLSPMNEPDYTFDEGGQEGMGVPVEQRAPLVQALGRALAERAPYCRVTADESSRVSTHFIQELSQWLSVPGTAQYVAALTHHGYDFPNDRVLQLARELAEDFAKPLWFTEVCCFDSRTGSFGQQFDPTIRSALLMAYIIWQGLTQANDAAFHWWVGCSSELGFAPTEHPGAVFEANDEGWNDGLLYYDPDYAANGNQAIYPTKRYYAMGNFSRHVRPGDRRHDVTGAPRNLLVMAFSRDADQAAAPAPQRPAGPIASPPAQRPSPQAVRRPGSGAAAGTSWAVVVVNLGPARDGPTALSLQLPLGGTQKLVADAAIETSAERNLEPVALPDVNTGGLLSALVPPQSITTFVLRSFATT
jgi:O-glycosyl hydrolase